MRKWIVLVPLMIGAGCTPPESATPSETPEKPAETGKTETPKADPMANIVGERSDLRDAKPLDGEEVGVIETKHGRIVLRFFYDKAPRHVQNFKELARAGFYNGTTFHRVIPGFMIQGGDPNTKDKDKSNDGMGGPGHNVDAEFNELSHVRGSLSMARSQDPNSAGSQFFIVHKDSANLDTQYTLFGRVVKTGKEAEDAEPDALKVVDKIVNVPRDAADNPNERIEMKVSIQKWPLK